MILYGISVSPFARKVLMYVAERGITCEHKPVGPHDADEGFKKASPTGKIPAFADGDYSLADSSAILHYLEAKFPADALIPAEPKARGKTIWFEEYADTVMFAAGTIIFFNRVVMPKIRKTNGDFAAADDSEKNKVPPVLAYLESCLSGDYLVGNSLTVADIAVINQLINLNHGGVPVDAAKYPRLAAYYQRIASRPSVSGIVAGEKKFLGL